MGFALCLVLLAMAAALFFVICPIIIIALSSLAAKIATILRFHSAAVFISYMAVIVYLSNKCYFVFPWQEGGNPAWLSMTGFLTTVIAGLWWFPVVWKK